MSYNWTECPYVVCLRARQMSCDVSRAYFRTEHLGPILFSLFIFTSDKRLLSLRYSLSLIISKWTKKNRFKWASVKPAQWSADIWLILLVDAFFNTLTNIWWHGRRPNNKHWGRFKHISFLFIVVWLLARVYSGCHMTRVSFSCILR